MDGHLLTDLVPLKLVYKEVPGGGGQERDGERVCVGWVVCVGGGAGERCVCVGGRSDKVHRDVYRVARSSSSHSRAPYQALLAGGLAVAVAVAGPLPPHT